MTRFFITIAIFIWASLVASCTPSEEEGAEAAAGRFLSAFYSMDYDTARGLCSESLSSRIGYAAEQFESVPLSIQKKIRLASDSTSFTITSIRVSEAEDSSFVEYVLKVPDLEKPVSKIIILICDEDRWIVADIQ